MLQVPTTQLAKISIDPKFVELTADLLETFFMKYLPLLIGSRPGGYLFSLLIYLFIYLVILFVFYLFVHFFFQEAATQRQANRTQPNPAGMTHTDCCAAVLLTSLFFVPFIILAPFFFSSSH